MKPAQFIISYFGGVNATGRVVGRSGAAVCQWRKPINQGGTDGQIPRKVQEKILKHSNRHQLKITADHLITGGTEAQLAAIL